MPLFSIMESDHDHPQNVPSSNVEAAKSRFLDSMGLGENSLRELAESGHVRETGEPVALSSQPDDMELPGVTNKNVSIRVQGSGNVKVSASGRATVSVDRPTEPAAEVPAEQTTAEEPAPVSEALVPEADEKVAETALVPEEFAVAEEAPGPEKAPAMQTAK